MYDINKLRKFVDVDALTDICGDGVQTKREQLIVLLVEFLAFINDEFHRDGVTLTYLTEYSWGYLNTTAREVSEALSCLISCGLVDLQLCEDGAFHYKMKEEA